MCVSPFLTHWTRSEKVFVSYTWKVRGFQQKKKKDPLFSHERTITNEFSFPFRVIINKIEIFKWKIAAIIHCEKSVSVLHTPSLLLFPISGKQAMKKIVFHATNCFSYRDTDTHARMLDNNTAMNVKNCKNQLKNFSQFNNFVFSVIIIPNSKKSFSFLFVFMLYRRHLKHFLL